MVHCVGAQLATLIKMSAMYAADVHLGFMFSLRESEQSINAQDR